MVGVKMGEEDGVEPKACAVAQHLTLRAFAAVEEEALAFAFDEEAGEVAIRCGRRGGGAEKGDSQARHGERAEPTMLVCRLLGRRIFFQDFVGVAEEFEVHRILQPIVPEPIKAISFEGIHPASGQFGPLVGV